ncbi:hypothetical protein B0H13DRAFT_2545863 [Mycena leptocephala]|nr:hypothetical protein B0H13DRAFT_2545863 [Mycena leptocephala]
MGWLPRLAYAGVTSESPAHDKIKVFDEHANIRSFLVPNRIVWIDTPFYPEISTTALGQEKLKHLSVHVSVDSRTIEKRGFDRKARSGPCIIKFQPPYSAEDTLHMELVKRPLIGKSTVLGVTKITVQDAERILRDHNVSELADWKKPNASHTVIRDAATAANDIRSVLEHLGRSYQVFEGLFKLSLGASELHPVAKAVLASVDQVFHAEDRCIKDIQDLVDDMACSLDFMTDVKQFSQLDQLKQALAEVDSLMLNTANFISRYTSRSRGSRIVSLTFGSTTRDELDKLTQHFNSFKERFDRGLAVQSGRALVNLQAQVELLIGQTALQQDHQALQMLKPQHGISKCGHEACMEDTRLDILKNIEEWIDDIHGPNLFWLYGHPGTGKSTIATTVRDRLKMTRHLGTSFFFRREEFQSQSPWSLWCSVAYNLAQQYPDIHHSVVTQLKLHEIEPASSTADTIFDQLVVVLLCVHLQVDPKRLPVVIIDALDECGGQQQSKARADQKQLLSALSRWQSLPTQIKILVTSRDEGDIRAVLGKGGLSSRILEEIKAPWPTEAQLESLVGTAAGLFIWASTVVKLFEDGPPEVELAQVLQSTAALSDTGADTLTQLYEGILTSKFTKPSQVQLFTDLVGSLIVARRPLSLEELSRLFPDIRPADFRMAQDLHFNMGDIKTSCKPNNDILGLLDKIPRHIQYSCQFWAAHLKNCGSGDFPWCRVVAFMESQLLYWLEVMSIGQKIGTACDSLQELIIWSGFLNSLEGCQG